jgi:hypothetical protein
LSLPPHLTSVSPRSAITSDCQNVVCILIPALSSSCA